MSVIDVTEESLEKIETNSDPLPDRTDLLRYSYILWYRHNQTPHVQKIFYHQGDLPSAIKRGQKHCEIMGYRMIIVRPLFIDLLAEEKFRVNQT